jgi:putative spermidine/putrescine transport system ATP-binding protein
VSDGPGVLVIRQEAVSLTAPGDPGADLTGRVTAVTAHGPRAAVEVAVAGVTVTAEVLTWDAPRPEDHVGVVLPVGRRHVVPGAVPRASVRAGEADARETVTLARPTR